MDWSETTIAIVKRGFDAREDYYLIAATVTAEVQKPVSVNAVRMCMVRYHGGEYAARMQEAQDARRERNIKITAMARAGIPAGDIALACGVKRDRVYDVVPSAQRVDMRWENVRRSKFWDLFGPEWARDAPLDETPEPLTFAGKTLVDLESGECRWPIGKDIDGSWRHCACVTERGRQPYCTEHVEQSRHNGKGRFGDHTFGLTASVSQVLHKYHVVIENGAEELAA